ncbi:MAG: hypothetical protein HW387_1504 [Parachlamydiales bacterium]|nr:hypothetical protein [Parachlamydiales bacterium]
MTDFFLHKANHIVNQTLADLNGENYFKSWALTVPARILYAIDAVIRVVSTALAMLSLVLSCIESFATWNLAPCKQSWQRLDLAVNQFINSTIGIVCTHLGYWLHTQDERPLERMLQTVAYIFPKWLGLSSNGLIVVGWGQR